MKKSLLLLVPFMVLVGCSINGLNPFGLSDENGSAGGLATLSLQVLEPGKGSIDVDELNITAANFTLVDVLAQTQTTNWAPGLSTYLLFQPIKPGTTTLTLRDIDVLNWTNTFTTNITVKSGYNYRIVVTLGGGIYMIETNASAALAYRYQMIYSETHNDTNIYAKGANLFAWNPATQITVNTNGGYPIEGTYSMRLIRAVSATNWIGIGFTQTNGVKDNSIYSGGHLKFSVKAFNTNNTYKIGIVSITGVTTNEAWVNLDAVPGYAIDGTWKVLSVPMSDFTGINFAGIYTYFALASINLQTNTNTTIDLDDVYWSRD